MLYKRLLISLLIPLALVMAALQVSATQAAQPTAPSVLTITVNQHQDGPLLPNATSCDADITPGNQCTLRAAIQLANRSNLAVVIVVPAGVYSLTITGSNEDAAATGDLDITRTVTINGAGASSTLIHWDTGIATTDRIFHIVAGSVSISGVTLQDAGFFTINDTADGGAIKVNAGASLSLMNSVITHTAASLYGGAILNEGTLHISNSTLGRGEAKYGGAIKSDGPLTLDHVTLSGNAASFAGGAIYGGDLSASNVTVVGNQATTAGGGLALFGTVTLSNTIVMSNIVQENGGGIANNAVLTVTHSSIVGNNADQSAGGILNNATLTLINTTLSGNSASLDGGLLNNGATNANNITVVNNTTLNGDGGGIRMLSGTLTLKNSILAGNHDNSAPADADCAGTLISLGYNLIQDTAGCTIAGTTTGNLAGVDPRLASLRRDANGTLTHAPMVNSPIIDAGSPSAPGSGGDACEATDQRGITRPQDGDDDGTARCDIGAVEVVRLVVNHSSDATLNPGSVKCETAPGNNICTLRAAVQASNRLNGPDIIRVPPGIYTLSIIGTEDLNLGNDAVGDLDLYDDVRIVGAGAASTFVQWNPSITPTQRDRIFDIPCSNSFCLNPYIATVRISGLTIRNGVAVPFGGSGINNFSGNLTLDDVAITGNGRSDTGAGGIYSLGPLTVCNSVISGNIAYDIAGIFAENLSMSNTLVISNSAAHSAGGIEIGDGGNAVLSHSQVSGNTAILFAGGIYNNRASLSIDNSAIVGNDADAEAGIASGGFLTISDSLISDNHAIGPQYGFAGGIDAGRLLLVNSTVSHNTAAGPYFYGGGGGIVAVAPILVNSAILSNTAAIVGGGISVLGSLTATNSTISGNASNTDGGGIYVFTFTQPTVSLTNVILSDNIADADGNGSGDGGGIWNGHTLLLNNSTLSGNRALSGGGIYQPISGSATLNASTISGNVAFSGGGIANLGALTTTNSTLSANTALNHGGGVANLGALKLSNSTLSGNRAIADGGGIYGAGVLTLTSVTVSDNTADSDADGNGSGGGIFVVPATGMATLKNTLIAGNHDDSPSSKQPDCFGVLASQGYNLIGDSTGCALAAATGDQIGSAINPIDPRLGPLQNNGGPTPTQALLPGSPAIDAGNPAGCTDANGNLLTTDQRGFVRPFGPRCDIGAFEFTLLRLFLPLIKR